MFSSSSCTAAPAASATFSSTAITKLTTPSESSPPRVPDRELLREARHAVRENRDLREDIHHQKREERQRDDAERRDRQQREAAAGDRVEQRRHDQHDRRRQRPE